jgi:RNA polymerase sigma-70 factor (ECF subfamily)
VEDVDWQECQACLAGDAEAGARLFKRYESDIARQMWRFSRDRDMCQELAQEVFVEAYTSLSRYKPAGVPFIHWLRCIATRVGYRYWKKEAKRKHFVALEGIDAPAEQKQLPEGPSRAAAILHQLLAALPVPDRLVLTLMYFEDCGIEQVAQRTGWRQGVVKMRAFRARQRLKKVIEQQHLADVLREFAYGNQ